VPRTGGIILAQAADKTGLEALLQRDPFQQAGLAQYTITEFIASRKAADAGDRLA